MDYSFKDLTAGNWNDFEKLFGANGACGGCWCMTWRLSSAAYSKTKGDGNKKLMKAIVKKFSPGVMAFANGEAVGWCAVAPRKEYVRLETSRVLKPVDDKEVWSVSCFFIKKDFRRKGLSTALLQAAVDFAFDNGAAIVEGYPVEQNKTSGKTMPDVFAWTGMAATFTRAGFKEVERRSESRPIMRLYKVKS
ncbi:MAG: GNAT family N-acetyltransferase [Bacteroidota bacterium]